MKRVDDSEDDDFEFKETEHEVTFFGFIKRISCFAHSLQLVVHKYNEVGSFGRVLTNAHALVRRGTCFSEERHML